MPAALGDVIVVLLQIAGGIGRCLRGVTLYAGLVTGVMEVASEGISWTLPVDEVIIPEVDCAGRHNIARSELDRSVLVIDCIGHRQIAQRIGIGAAN